MAGRVQGATCNASSRTMQNIMMGPHQLLCMTAFLYEFCDMVHRLQRMMHMSSADMRSPLHRCLGESKEVNTTAAARSCGQSIQGQPGTAPPASALTGPGDYCQSSRPSTSPAGKAGRAGKLQTAAKLCWCCGQCCSKCKC